MIQVAIYLQRELERAAFSALFRQQPGFDVIGAPTSEFEAVCLCQTKRPEAIVADATLPIRRGMTLPTLLLCSEFTKCVVLLGDVRDGTWDHETDKLPGVTYVSRHDALDRLIDCIHRTCGIELPNEVNSSHPTPQPTILPIKSPHFATLTPRERDIFCLLVEGKSPRQCADALNLALSTIDNHKARIMKKLNVHKTVDLVRMAIREGIVSP